MDKQHFTFEEIIDELKVSKSAASNGIQNLLQYDTIEYITITGDRKRYFQLKKHAKFKYLDNIDNVLIRMNDLLAEINALSEGNSPHCSSSIRNMILMNNIFRQHIAATKDDYNRLTQQGGAPSNIGTDV